LSFHQRKIIEESDYFSDVPLEVACIHCVSLDKGSRTSLPANITKTVFISRVHLHRPFQEAPSFASSPEPFSAIVPGIIPVADLQRMAEIVVDRGLMVLSDEIYSGMQYEGTPVSIATFPGLRERTIILDGFSKRYAMTGWRLGYGVGNREVVAHFTKLMANSASCTASFVQMAGVAALRGPQGPSQQMVAEFRRRREIIVKGLNEIPRLRCAMPRGAFYAFPNVQACQRSSAELASHLLNAAGIACLAGTAFGQYGEGYVRFSYANSEENIRKMLEKLAHTLRDLPP